MMKMETKNWTQIIVLVGGILVGIVTGIIITAHHFGKTGGKSFSCIYSHYGGWCFNWRYNQIFS